MIHDLIRYSDDYRGRAFSALRGGGQSLGNLHAVASEYTDTLMCVC